MSDLRGIVGRQAEALADVLRERREHRCREIITEAERRAARLERESRRSARERMHEAVDEERRRRERAIVEARRRLETAERKRIQARYDELLGLAWPHLIRELKRRWSRPDDRAEWCSLLVDEACRQLGTRGWTITTPDTGSDAWSGDDAAMLASVLSSGGVTDVDFQADTDLEAGLRIRRGGARLDGSIEGLLSHRLDIEGRLLACWETEVRRTEGHSDG